MGEGRLTDIIAEFYELSKRLGTTRNDKTRANLFDNLIGLNFWYTTDFNKGALSVRIHEWRNMMAAYPYLDSITIKHKGNIVYDANVHRDSIYIHSINVLSSKPEWIVAMYNLLEEYVIPCKI